MKTQRLIRHGLRGMGRHRLRTFFMMLGTVVGVLALPLVVALGQGTRGAVPERWSTRETVAASGSWAIPKTTSRCGVVE